MKKIVKSKKVIKKVKRVKKVEKVKKIKDPEVVTALSTAIACGIRITAPGVGTFIVGKQYFIRTITFHTVGRLISFENGFLQLDEAMWVADSGRYYDALKEGLENINESQLEPIPGIQIINVMAICDACEYLPKINVMQK
jgi:hypothetical protein